MSSIRLHTVCLLSLLGLVCVSETALAQDIEAAERAEHEGHIVDANALYLAVLAHGGLSSAETAAVHLRLGVLARALGAEPSDAAMRFALALAIAPDIAAPVELSPTERASFESLRGPGYRFEAQRHGDTVHLRILGPPAAESVRAAVAGVMQELSIDGDAVTIAIAPRTEHLDAVALDGHGNVLHEERVTIAAPPALAAVRLAPSTATNGELDCPTSGDPCAWPAHCRTGVSDCEASDPPWAIIGVVGGGVLLAVAAILVSVLAVDAYNESLWRVDRAGTR